MGRATKGEIRKIEIKLLCYEECIVCVLIELGNINTNILIAFIDFIKSAEIKIIVEINILYNYVYASFQKINSAAFIPPLF